MTWSLGSSETTTRDSGFQAVDRNRLPLDSELICCTVHAGQQTNCVVSWLFECAVGAWTRLLSVRKLEVTARTIRWLEELNVRSEKDDIRG